MSLNVSTLVTLSNNAGAQQDLSFPEYIMLLSLPEQLLQKYRNIEQQLGQCLPKLSQQRRRGLDNFIKRVLYNDIPDNKQPNIPRQATALFKHLQRYYNSVCIDLLMQLADHLHDKAPAFKAMVEDYQQLLHVCLRRDDVRWDQRTRLRQPEGYTTLIVRMDHGTQETAAKAQGTQQFWADELKQMGSKSGIPILFAGLTAHTHGTSLVFFVSERYNIKLFDRAQRNKAVIYDHGIVTFTVPGQVTLNTKNGRTVSPCIQCHTY